jgi:hypothetical protein
VAHGIRVTDVLARSLRIWVRNLAPFTIAIALTYAPLLALLALPEPRMTCPAISDLLLVFGAMFAACLLWVATPAAVARGVLRQLRGEPMDLAACLRAYGKGLLPVLRAGLAIGLVGVPCVIACEAVTNAFGTVIPNEEALPLVGLTVAGALTACLCWVAVPVAAAESTGGMASLARSIQLTRGARRTVFLVAVVTLALQFLPLFVLGAYVPASPLGAAAMLLVAAVLSAPGAIATVVGYHDLRAAKEGTADLAGVFA